MALGLNDTNPGYSDDLNSLSYGMEYPNNVTPFLRFSMAWDNMGLPDGLPWTDVNKESTCMAFPGQATGDEFDAPMPPPPGPFNTNTLVLDENGVQDNAACAAPPGYPVGTGAPPGDNIDTLEERPPSFVDTNGDGYPERPVFFTLVAGPTLSLIGATMADILMKDPYSPPLWPPMIYTPASHLGLNGNGPNPDVIDGLMLYDNGDRTLLGVPTFGCGDWAWLSLAPNSPTLLPLGATPADVLFVDGCHPGVIEVQYRAEVFGLCGFLPPPIGCDPGPAPFDDVDALKGSIPCLTGPTGRRDRQRHGDSRGRHQRARRGGPGARRLPGGDDDNDGYPDQSEFVQFDPIACPAKTALTSPGGDITYDDNNNGNPAPPMGTDAADDGPSWDSDADGVLDGVECTLRRPGGEPPTSSPPRRHWRHGRRRPPERLGDLQVGHRPQCCGLRR